MAQQAGVATTDLLGMLAAFGRDVAGALVITPADEHRPYRQDASQPTTEPLDAGDLAAEVSRLPEHPLGLHDDSELSIAGLQDKLLLVRTEDGWARPRFGFPSTHILKIDDRVHAGVIRAEHACLQLARSAGLAATAGELVRVGDAECLAVERFDRARIGSSVTRTHQEDACQALGIDAEGNQRRAKYEQHGGPTFRRVAELLEAWSADPESELLELLARAVFTTVIGDADAHGKNLSLLHPEPSVVRLAPLYDTVPTALWPTLRTEAAMSINGRFRLADVTSADLIDEAYRWGISRRRASHRIADVVERFAAVLEAKTVDVPPALAELVATNLARLS